MSKEKRIIKENKKSKSSPFNDYWDRNNYITLFISIGVLILGYFLMSIGPWDSAISLSVSPVVLLIGYLVIIPLVIFIKFPLRVKKVTDDTGKN